MMITPHFSLKELAGEFDEIYLNLIRLANNLEVLRRSTGPLTVSSGWRSKEHNRAVGGAPSSLHLRGLACDIKASNWTPKQLYDLIVKLQREEVLDKGGLGLYTHHVHYDIRGKIVRWRSEKP